MAFTLRLQGSGAKPQGDRRFENRTPRTAALICPAPDDLNFRSFPASLTFHLAIGHFKLVTHLTAQPYYVGLAATTIDGNTGRIGVSIHDGIDIPEYWTSEFTVSHGDIMEDLVSKNTMRTIIAYSTNHRVQFGGAGVTLGLEEMCRGISAQLWRELDLVGGRLDTLDRFEISRMISIDVGQQAYWAARECVRCIGPHHDPTLSICVRRRVIPDATKAVTLVKNLQEYKKTVHESTWNDAQNYAHELRGYKDGQIKVDSERSC
ncbi:hypothetical protein HOY80DRAFT_1114697 [Tuber brumale]|nr:hypothetical protein HOY80DRAFT_1114697 [Tuber brumale]